MTVTLARAKVEASCPAAAVTASKQTRARVATALEERVAAEEAVKARGWAAEPVMWTEVATAEAAVEAVLVWAAADVAVAMAMAVGTAASRRVRQVGTLEVEVTALVDQGSVEVARALVTEETAVVAEPALGLVVA